jgi:geranylgeranyl transferase type-2 subunit beta
MADVFHTFFGIAGLSLLGHLHTRAGGGVFRRIDPVYALPTDTVKRLGLRAQVVARKDQEMEDRLAHYEVHRYNQS